MTNDQQAGTAKTADAADVAAQPSPHKSIGLVWRLVASGVAVVVIGVLLYPLFGQQETAPLPENTVAGSSSPIASADALATSAQAQFEIGNQFYETGQWNEAVAAYQKAIELDPNYQDAYANLGVTYYQLQEYELAATQYEKAMELNPNDGDVAYNLGALYLQQALSQNPAPNPQLLEQAIAQLQQALDISPNLAEPYFSLGVAYYFAGQAEAATTSFEQFLQLTPESDSLAVEEAQTYLEQLRGN